jgi:hypothetical protein
VRALLNHGYPRPVIVAGGWKLGKKIVVVGGWLPLLALILLSSVRVRAEQALVPGSQVTNSKGGLAEVLHVQAGATCVDPVGLGARVTEWLGDRPLDPGLRIDVWGDPRDARHVRFSLRRGERVLTERSFAPAPAQCGQLHAVLSLAIALAVRAALLEELELPQPSEAQPFRRGQQGELTLLLGSLDRPLELGLGAAGSLALLPWFDARIALRSLLHRGGAIEGTRGTYDRWTTLLSAQGCLVARGVTRLVLRTCTGPGLGPLSARGRSLPHSERAVLLWAGWLARLDALVAITPRLGIDLGAELALALRDLKLVVRAPDGQIAQRTELEQVHLVGSLGLIWQL